MFSIASNIADLRRELRGFSRDQMPFAVSLALNETGKDLLEHNKTEMNRVFGIGDSKGFHLWAISHDTLEQTRRLIERGLLALNGASNRPARLSRLG